MRFDKTLYLAALLFFCIGVKGRTNGIFEDYKAKFRAFPPLRLDDGSYNQLTSAPRNYSFVVLLTALENRFGCRLCRDFQSEWDLLSKSWVKGDKSGESRTLFGTLDFNDGKGTFQKVVCKDTLIL